MTVIALISCTKSKQDYACPAKELYAKSANFRHAYAYADQIADKIYILSARHGLVGENESIEPYDETLRDKSAQEKTEWAAKTAKSLSAVSDLENDEYVILAGKAYYEKLLPWIKHYRLPLAGVGMYDRLGVLKELIGKKEPAGMKMAAAPVEKKIGSHEITTFIDKLLDEARAEGKEYLDVVSGSIHKELGLKNRMPQVCNAMYKKMSGRDKVIKTTPSGYSSTIIIRYYLT